MARRAQSKLHPACIILVVLLVVGALVGGFMVYNQVDDPFRAVEDLDVAAYQSNANSLVGNTYKVDGRVVSFLDSQQSIRLYEIAVTSGNREHLLSIVVPSNLDANLQAQQRFWFKVRVTEGGLLVVEGLNKV